MNNRLHLKLFIKISIIVIVIEAVFLIFFSNYAFNSLSESYKASLEEVCVKTADNVNNILQDMDQLAVFASANPTIIEEFSNARKYDVTNQVLAAVVGSTLNSITVPNETARFRICLYNKKGNYVSSGILYDKNVVKSKVNSNEFQSWYDEIPIISNKASYSALHKDYWTERSIRYLSLYREIYDKSIISLPTGIVEIQCPENKINEILVTQENISFCIVDQDNNIILYNGDEQLQYKEILNTIEPDELSNSFKKYKDLIISKKNLVNNWQLISFKQLDKSKMIINQMIVSTFLISIIIVLVLLIAFFFTIKENTKPLRQLTQSINSVSDTITYLEAPPKSYSYEITTLQKAFNNMLKRLDDSMNENIKIRTYEIRSNFIALQSKMNPHFFCNMLTIINILSQEKENDKIVKICDQLAWILRYSVKYEENGVTLEEELCDAEIYLNLLKIRYEQQFEYQVIIHEEVDVKSIYIPKLIFQPLIENSFKHGFYKKMTPWKINIECSINEDKLIIRFEDNGVGILQEDIDKLQSRVDEFIKNPSAGVASLEIGDMGLINTIIRLKLFYNEECSVDIRKMDSSGTAITFTVSLK